MCESRLKGTETVSHVNKIRDFANLLENVGEYLLALDALDAVLFVVVGDVAVLVHRVNGDVVLPAAPGGRLEDDLAFLG